MVRFSDNYSDEDYRAEWHMYRILTRRLLEKAEEGELLSKSDMHDMRTLLEEGMEGI